MWYKKYKKVIIGVIAAKVVLVSGICSVFFMDESCGEGSVNDDNSKIPPKEEAKDLNDLKSIQYNPSSERKSVSLVSNSKPDPSAGVETTDSSGESDEELNSRLRGRRNSGGREEELVNEGKRDQPKITLNVQAEEKSKKARENNVKENEFLGDKGVFEDLKKMNTLYAELAKLKPNRNKFFSSTEKECVKIEKELKSLIDKNVKVLNEKESPLSEDSKKAHLELIKSYSK